MDFKELLGLSALVLALGVGTALVTWAARPSRELSQLRLAIQQYQTERGE